MSWKTPPENESPLLRSARRESRIILIFWLLCGAWTLTCAKFLAYRPVPEGAEITLVLGIPAWVFWSVLLPWLAATVFTVVFALRGMEDHDLRGEDETREEDS